MYYTKDNKVHVTKPSDIQGRRVVVVDAQVKVLSNFGITPESHVFLTCMLYYYFIIIISRFYAIQICYHRFEEQVLRNR